jgi:hypothetical protein
VQSHLTTRFLGCTMKPEHHSSPALLLRASVGVGPASNLWPLNTFLLGTRVMGRISVIGGEAEERVWGSWSQHSPLFGYLVPVVNFPANNVFPQGT